MQEVTTKPKHTDRAHCAGCRVPSRAQLEGRQTQRIIDAQRQAKENYEAKRRCTHPARFQFITVLAAEEDSNGRVLDGARVKICGVCLVQFGETF